MKAISLYNGYRLIVWTLAVLFALGGSTALAGNDSSINGELRQAIQARMVSHIEGHTVEDTYFLFDAAEGKLLALKFKQLHKGIVRKGAFYVSCADFVDQEGRLVDLDFLVIPQGAGLLTAQAIVHAVDGQKRKYHLE
ncbi:MAG: hypothetical protein JJV98_07850 [Desulfosarcina sp.]|nr:hypothetical protein [Desulfobacterales bacterium]